MLECNELHRQQALQAGSHPTRRRHGVLSPGDRSQLHVFHAFLFFLPFFPKHEVILWCRTSFMLSPCKGNLRPPDRAGAHTHTHTKPNRLLFKVLVLYSSAEARRTCVSLTWFSQTNSSRCFIPCASCFILKSCLGCPLFPCTSCPRERLLLVRCQIFRTLRDSHDRSVFPFIHFMCSLRGRGGQCCCHSAAHHCPETEKPPGAQRAMCPRPSYCNVCIMKEPR